MMSVFEATMMDMKALRDEGIATDEDIQELIDIQNGPASVYDTALYILSKIGTITTKKLQKLCYYAQVRSLAAFDTPLFEEDFQAWEHGPVCPPLFRIHRRQRNITAEKLAHFGDINRLSPRQRQVIDDVLKEYGDKDAQFLEEKTHQEAPWLDARGGLPLSARCKNIITKESIKAYYSLRSV